MRDSAETAFRKFADDLRATIARRPPEQALDRLARGTWIYGAGRFGRLAAKAMAALGIPCLGFIDRLAATVPSIDGLPLADPLAFVPDRARGRTLAVAVSDSTLEDFRPFAESLPFLHFVSHVDLADALGERACVGYLSTRAYLAENLGQICTAMAGLADIGSVEAMAGVLGYRLTGRHDGHYCDADNQYLPRDLAGLDSPVSFLDGGAFDGDTFRFLSARGVRIRHWIAFEPDAGNFRQLLKTPVGDGCRATLFPCGLADAYRQEHFEGDRRFSSSIVAEPSPTSTVITCVAFDEAMPDTEVDYVKLDVEGFESAALRGMSRTLGRCRPRIAAAAYHRPADLWEIAAQLRSLLPDCSIHLRHHSSKAMETVVYALPSSKGASRAR